MGGPHRRAHLRSEGQGRAAARERVVSKLPPWKAHNPRERKMMHDWVNAKLDEMEKAERKKQANSFRVIPSEHVEKYRAWRRDAGFERQAARAGFIEPLRRCYPHLAEFLFPPKLKRGEKYQDFDHTDEIDLAVRDVRRMIDTGRTGRLSSRDLRHHAASVRTPLVRMLPTVIGRWSSWRRAAISADQPVTRSLRADEASAAPADRIAIGVERSADAPNSRLGKPPDRVRRSPLRHIARLRRVVARLAVGDSAADDSASNYPAEDAGSDPAAIAPSVG